MTTDVHPYELHHAGDSPPLPETPEEAYRRGYCDAYMHAMYDSDDMTGQELWRFLKAKLRPWRDANRPLTLVWPPRP